MTSTQLMEIDYAGRVAVVTGAARGIGAGLVSAFADAGAAVLALDRDAAELAAAQESRHDRRVVTEAVDVTQWEDVAAAAQEARSRWGRLDVWVNCAGVFPQAPLEEVTADHLAATFAVNVHGAVAGAQAAAQHLTHGSGAIINVSSIAATRPRPGRLAYGTSKAALEQATRCLAVELAPYGIRANAIAPGYIDTAMLDWIRRDAQATQQATFEVPLGRIGCVDDIVNTALFLASDAAAYITGVVLPVDGGLRATTARP
ncbi:MAG TPA: glucose 1-dehydrogenase [Nocardioidaceae bacterium]|nr:glucose 1-dehydrogenase [Nocardioidaceae bacterium]